MFEEIKYKLHACCHGTHAMIEALAAVKRGHNLTTDRVAHIDLRTNPRWLSVCDIKKPRTGLEVKFSYIWLAGMALSGIPTSADRAYTDALAHDPALSAFARKISVIGDPEVTDMQAIVEVTLTDGTALSFCHDLAAPLGADVLERSLRLKAEGLLGNEAADLWRTVEHLEARSAADLGKRLRAS